jgi:hypothetical protein
MSSNANAKEVALEIDQITERVGPLLQKYSHLSSAMALAMMAAHHVLHDDGDEEDFLTIARTSWERSQEIHCACTEETRS